MFVESGVGLAVYGFTADNGQKRRRKYLDAVLRGYIGNYDPLIRFPESTQGPDAAL
jgi:hypothetical protein